MVFFRTGREVLRVTFFEGPCDVTRQWCKLPSTADSQCCNHVNPSLGFDSSVAACLSRDSTIAGSIPNNPDGFFRARMDSTHVDHRPWDARQHGDSCFTRCSTNDDASTSNNPFQCGEKLDRLKIPRWDEVSSGAR